MIEPIPAVPGQPERFDYKDTRNGTTSLFLISEPLLEWRAVKMTGRTAVDLSEVVDVRTSGFQSFIQIFIF